MYNFFVEENKKNNNRYYISENDYNHIKNVLRMNIGDTFLVSNNGKSDLCSIEKFEENLVVAVVVEENYQTTELPVKIYLFQGLPKSDKMELIIQKTVELGVDTIVPVQMNRCVVKLEEKKIKAKTARWQAIAESAAKQSKRNFIPEIMDTVSYKQALKMCENLDLILVPYENADGMVKTKKLLNQLNNNKTVGIIIGPEGGFDESEIESAVSIGANSISLGKRILRTETAAITAVGMCMLNIEMNEGIEE